MSERRATKNPCDSSDAEIVEGRYPYRYYHFWTQLYEKKDGPKAATPDERGRCIRMAWDQEQVLGNWWHALVDEMFTEAAQRGAAYRGRASDWVEDAPEAARSLPMPLRRSGDPCADPDPQYRPTYRGGSDAPLSLTEMEQECIELLPAAELLEGQDGERWLDKQLWLTHELELEAYRMRCKSKTQHDNELQAAVSLQRRLEMELTEIQGVTDFMEIKKQVDADDRPYSLGGKNAIQGELDVCKQKVRALQDERARIWGKTKKSGGLRVPPVGSAAILPWLLLHPAHRSPTFRWYMRTVGGPMLTRERQKELEEKTGSTKGAFVTVDLRDVAKRAALLRGERPTDQGADPEVEDMDTGAGGAKEPDEPDEPDEADGNAALPRTRPRKGAGGAVPGTSDAATEGVYGRRVRQTVSEDDDVMDPASWDAPHLRALWRATALLHDVGVKMAHIANVAPPADALSASAKSFPFWVPPDDAAAAPRYRLGPSAETDKPDRKKHELLWYISGCPMKDLEFAGDWELVNKARRSSSAAEDQSEPRDDDPAPQSESAAQDQSEPRDDEPAPRMPVTVLAKSGVDAQIDAVQIGWHRIRKLDDGSSSCNWADALRCEVARLAERLIVEAEEWTSPGPTLLMMALDVADEGAADKLTALKSGTAQEKWTAAFALLGTFFEHGVAEAMRATSDSSRRYASSVAAERREHRFDTNLPDGLTEKVETGLVLEATGLSNGVEVFAGIGGAIDPLTHVQGKLRTSQRMRTFDTNAMRELKQIKTACFLLAARTELRTSDAPNGDTEWRHRRGVPFLAAVAEANDAPQSVFDQQEEVMLGILFGEGDAPIKRRPGFALGTRGGTQGPVIPLAVRARELANRVFGTVIERTGRVRAWRATLARREARREDGVVIFDDGTPGGQTGPPAFHFLANEGDIVDGETVRRRFIEMMEQKHGAQFGALPPETKTGLATSFFEEATRLRNSFGDINMFPDLYNPGPRWPELNLDEYATLEAAFNHYCKTLKSYRRNASTLQAVREAWALDRTIRTVDTTDPNGYCWSLFSRPPPRKYPLNGTDVDLWVPRYDFDSRGRSFSISEPDIVDKTAAAVSVANAALEAKVSALTVARELRDALRLDVLISPGSVSDVEMGSAEAAVAAASDAADAAQAEADAARARAQTVARAAEEAFGEGLYPRLAFFFKNDTPQYTDADWHTFVHEPDDDASIATEVRLRKTSMAPFVFLKQRECEMQLVYTVQNKALGDHRTSAHWDKEAAVLNFTDGGVKVDDALEHVRTPSLLRTRAEEFQRSQTRARHVMACPEASVVTGAAGQRPLLWTDGAAPHMLDVPTSALYAFGIVANLDDNSGTVPANAVAPGNPASEADWSKWLGKTLSAYQMSDEDALALKTLEATGERKLAAVLFQSSVCTCDTEAIQQNAASWRENPERAFASDLTLPLNVKAAIVAARKVIQRRYVPSAWARRAVVESPEGVAGDEHCVITPERYQHPAIFAHSENWQMNDHGIYERVDNSKPALDFEYVVRRYNPFMRSLGPRLRSVEEEAPDAQHFFGTREYQGGSYWKINALLKLARHSLDGRYFPSSRSALGPYWAKLQVEGLYASSIPAARESRYKNHAVMPNRATDSVEQYPKEDEHYACSLYTLMYHLYENPDWVGSTRAENDPQKNPYAQTYEQWTANHTLAMVYLRNVYKVRNTKDLNLDVERVRFGESSWRELDNSLATFLQGDLARRQEAANLIVGQTPMPYTDFEQVKKSPIFMMHKLLKTLYMAPRLEREIQVVRSEANFDFLCDGYDDPGMDNANMLKRTAAFQTKNLRVGQRFVSQAFTSTSMVSPHYYLLKQSTETDEAFEALYDTDGELNHTMADAFYGSTKHGGKDIPCCLHLFTLAKGMPILPMFLTGKVAGETREWLDSKYEDEEEILLPPNCEMEFLGTTFVFRHHQSEKEFMDPASIKNVPDNAQRPFDTSDPSPTNNQKKEWRTSERVIAYCWFVRYRGVPRGGWLLNDPTPPETGADAIRTSEANLGADAGEYTDDEDLDWGVGTLSPRAHLREHLHEKDEAHKKRFEERYGRLNEHQVFEGVVWPD